MSKMNLPSRKEMNQDAFNDLVSELAEYTTGGDHVIMGELFPMIFSDLSAAMQEYYIRMLKRKLSEKKRKWIVFYRKSTHDVLCEISIEGYFSAEIRATKELLAADLNIDVSDIEIKLKKEARS